MNWYFLLKRLRNQSKVWISNNIKYVARQSSIYLDFICPVACPLTLIQPAWVTECLWLRSSSLKWLGHAVSLQVADICSLSYDSSAAVKLQQTTSKCKNSRGSKYWKSDRTPGQSQQSRRWKFQGHRVKGVSSQVKIKNPSRLIIFFGSLQMQCEAISLSKNLGAFQGS